MAKRNVRLKADEKGFSLMEISIVLVVLGLMVGGIASALTQDLRRTKQINLKNKMDAIEQALGAFVKKNNRLPCPADATYTITNVRFGFEGSTAGTSCITGATYDGNGNRSANPTPSTANFYISTFAGGVVPVRTLGLADEYAFDSWGGRFSYVVDTTMTATDSFTSYFLNYPFASKISVNDISGSTNTTIALAVVLSHGANGHGAFQLNGTRKNAGITNTNELTNCHCDNTGTAGVFSNSFVSGRNTASSTDLRDSFDDVLRYYTRGSFLTNTDVATEIK